MAALCDLAQVRGVPLSLRRLTGADVEAHNDGGDEATIKWLTGGYGTASRTLAHFQRLALNEAAARGKRGFGVWLGHRLAGYVDRDPDKSDCLAEGEVNISDAIHPWTRGHGVATKAVELICNYIRANAIGRAAAVRVEPENSPSVRVAERAGFQFVREFVSSTDKHADGPPVTPSLHRRAR